MGVLGGFFYLSGELDVIGPQPSFITKAIRLHQKTPTPRSRQQPLLGVVYIYVCMRRSTWQRSFIVEIKSFPGPRVQTEAHQIICVEIRLEANCYSRPPRCAPYAGSASPTPYALSRLKPTHGNMEKLPPYVGGDIHSRKAPPSIRTPDVKLCTTPLLEHECVMETWPG